MASPETVSSTQMRSGVVTVGTPSSQPTANSFWKASSNRWPRKAPRPSSLAVPRRKPSVARRATSAILPVERRGAVELGRPAQEALGRAAGHVGDLAGEEQAAVLGLDQRLDRITMGAPGR